MAKTQACNEFLECIRGMIQWWGARKDASEAEKLHGVAFTILAMLDGVHGPWPYSTSIRVKDEEGNESDLHGDGMLHDLL